MSAELAFNRNVDVDYGVAEEVAPGVRRIVANNPGPYTFLGSNTYLVGRGRGRGHRPWSGGRSSPERHRRGDQGRAHHTYPHHPQSS